MKERLFNFYRKHNLARTHTRWLSGGGHNHRKETVYAKEENYYLLDNLCANDLCRGTGTNYAYPEGEGLEHHKKYNADLYQELTGLKLDSLHFPRICGLAGTDVDENTVIPPIAYRLGYYMWQIKNLCDLSKRNVILEIGGGWGAMAHLVFNNVPNVTYVIVDIPVSIMVSAYFLHKCGKRVYLPGEFPSVVSKQIGYNSPNWYYSPTEISKEFLSDYDVVFLLPEQLTQVNKGLCDVICSCACLPELPTESIDYYFKEIGRICPSHLYVDFTYNGRGKHVASACDGLGTCGFDNLLTQETPINTYIPPVVPTQRKPQYIEERIYRT